VVKETIHITPKQMIDYYLTALIKKTLLTTSLTFQQIADKLNFTDQSAMGQFFKRNTGMTLSEFRNKHI
jgi:AraC family transcriptional activator of pobA